MQTPLQKLTRISRDLGIELFIKRDDLYPLPGGGNKARKLDVIIPKAIENGYNAVVTTGSNQSNHVRATALRAAELGWKSIMIIHDKRPDIFTGNLKISKLLSTELRFVPKELVKTSMEEAMTDLKNTGYNPLYIWGGGHSVEGSYAYYLAVKELREQMQNQEIDFIVLASGTGTTQAGIEIGVRLLFKKCKVLGVSVSRERERGSIAVRESANDLLKILKKDINISDIFFDDSKMGTGYESVFPGLQNTIELVARNEGILLDPTYTGKAFYALMRYVDEGIIDKGSKVVFWHTGGLLNLLSSYHI